MKKGEFGILFLICLLPILFYYWIFKMLFKGIKALAQLGENKPKVQITKKSKGSWIPSEEDIDRYEMYDAIFDDDEF